MSKLPGATFLEKTDSPHPTDAHFSARSRVFKTCSAIHAEVSTGLVLCRQPQLLCIHEYNEPVVSRRFCFIWEPHNPWFLQSFYHLIRMLLKPYGRRRCDVNVPFRTEFAIIINSLLSLPFSGSLLISIQCKVKKKSFFDINWKITNL